MFQEAINQICPWEGKYFHTSALAGKRAGKENKIAGLGRSEKGCPEISQFDKKEALKLWTEDFFQKTEKFVCTLQSEINMGIIVGWNLGSSCGKSFYELVGCQIRMPLAFQRTTQVLPLRRCHRYFKNSKSGMEIITKFHRRFPPPSSPSCSDIKTFPDIYAKRALILKSSNMGCWKLKETFVRILIVKRNMPRKSTSLSPSAQSMGVILT